MAFPLPVPGQCSFPRSHRGPFIPAARLLSFGNTEKRNRRLTPSSSVALILKTTQNSMLIQHLTHKTHCLQASELQHLNISS